MAPGELWAKGRRRRPDQAGLAHILVYFQKQQKAFEEFKPEGNMLIFVFQKGHSGGITEMRL